MDLTVHDVAALCRVTERTVYRWIKASAIPTYRIGDHYRFNRAELLAWASRTRIGMPTDALAEEPADRAPLPRVSDALALGGIHYRVGGATKNEVLRAAGQVMHVPDDIDRAILVRMLLAREALATTAVGNGIAIPHARNPIVLCVPRTLVALCFLEQGVAFGALDGKPVHSLLVLVAKTVREHLHVLARLAFMLHDPALLESLRRQDARAAIMHQIARLEQQVQHPAAPPGILPLHKPARRGSAPSATAFKPAPARASC